MSYILRFKRATRGMEALSVGSITPEACACRETRHKRDEDANAGDETIDEPHGETRDLRCEEV